MLTIAAVQIGNYCGLGKEYVAQLFNGVKRNLQGEYRFACMTDDPSTLPDGVTLLPPTTGLQGWWNKVALFKPGTFPDGDRVLYFDLDQVIIGDIGGFAKYRGRFAAVWDFYQPYMNSSVMSWQAGTLAHIWECWDQAGRPQTHPGGDQRWIAAMERAEFWQTFLPGQIASFKAYCKPLGGIPSDIRVLSFHGKPRPHEADDAFYLPYKPAELRAPSDGKEMNP